MRSRPRNKCAKAQRRKRTALETWNRDVTRWKGGMVERSPCGSSGREGPPGESHRQWGGRWVKHRCGSRWGRLGTAYPWD